MISFSFLQPRDLGHNGGGGGNPELSAYGGYLLGRQLPCFLEAPELHAAMDHRVILRASDPRIEILLHYVVADGDKVRGEPGRPPFHPAIDGPGGSAHFLGKGDAVDPIYDDRHAFLLRGDSTEDTRLGAVRMDDRVVSVSDDTANLHEGFELGEGRGVSSQAVNGAQSYSFRDANLLYHRRLVVLSDGEIYGVLFGVDAVYRVERVLAGTAVRKTGDDVQDAQSG